VRRAFGCDEVEGAIISEVDERFEPVSGTERIIEADTISLAVGLSPRLDLLLAGPKVPTAYSGCFGGHVPLHDARMQVRPGLLVAGDVSGIEEASTALEEGRLAGLAAADNAGLISPERAAARYGEIERRLRSLRSGRYGEKRRLSKEHIVGACGGGYTF
jgi:pyruvate/2-oxoglutarate dehydrogenase complex dihydrolipoamide dehydrogenase (E3) component